MITSKILFAVVLGTAMVGAAPGDIILCPDCGSNRSSGVDGALEQARRSARNARVDQIMRNMSLPPHRRAEAERMADMEARARQARGLSPYPAGPGASPAGAQANGNAAAPSASERMEQMRADMLRRLPPNSPCARYLRARGEGWSTNPCV